MVQRTDKTYLNKNRSDKDIKLYSSTFIEIPNDTPVEYALEKVRDIVNLKKLDWFCRLNL